MERLQVRVKWLTHKAYTGAVPENLSEVLALTKSNTPVFEVTLLQDGGAGAFIKLLDALPNIGVKIVPTPCAHDLSQ